MLRRGASLALVAGLVSAGTGLALATPSDASRRGQQIKMEDDCEKVSFNDAIEPGACVGDGDTTFGAFIAELAATKAAADWKFDPSQLTIRGGRPVILENRGGETHTFTLVKAFGGGFVAPLNEVSGNPVPAEECATLTKDGLAPKPPSAVNVYVEADKEAAFETAGLKPGEYMFECCIHPWMRIVLTVE